MAKEHLQSSDRNLLHCLKIGREVVRTTQSDQRRRIAVFLETFEDAAPECTKAYFRGGTPIIQPENASPLSIMLLDGLVDGSVKLHNVANRRPELKDEHLQGEGIQVLTQISHRRLEGDHTVVAELDQWFVGTVNCASLTYGSHVPILLQPAQVELTRPESPAVVPDITRMPY